MEQHVNKIRGMACFIFTIIGFLLLNPSDLLYWTNFNQSSGTLGFILNFLWLLYFTIDLCVTISYRHKFQRKVFPLFLHHILAMSGILMHFWDPPKFLFLYITSEALTAARVLPCKWRDFARHYVFMYRRLLWVYLVFVAVAMQKHFMLTVNIALICLDIKWWGELSKKAQMKHTPSG